jgi:ribose 5-phosphate isomerase A
VTRGHHVYVRRPALHRQGAVPAGVARSAQPGSPSGDEISDHRRVEKASAVDRIGDLLEKGELKNLVAVPTSIRTYEQAKALGIPLATLDEQPAIDVAIDGADEVDPNLDVVKGRGGALLREKMVENASKLFVCIVDDTKLVDGLGGSQLAMPVEIVQFCHQYTLSRLAKLPEVSGCDAKLRMEGDKPYVTDNSNYIVDLYFKTPIKDANAAAKAILEMDGVVDHGLFMNMVDVCIVAGENGVELKERPGK